MKMHLPVSIGAKKAPSTHQLAPHFPKGPVLQDLHKQEWNLGEVIGKGGFGLKYLEHFNPVQKISIDKAMIPFHGRLCFKQYIPGKPLGSQSMVCC